MYTKKPRIIFSCILGYETLQGLRLSLATAVAESCAQCRAGPVWQYRISL